VLASNVRVGYLEIDLVVLEGRTLAIVEVRTRGDGAWTSPFGSISGLKRERLRRAAERLWNRRYRYDARIDHVRVDAASVTWVSGKPRIEYVKAI
jgi:Holliday junction resolvase-like predicted endonuclease